MVEQLRMMRESEQAKALKRDGVVTRIDSLPSVLREASVIHTALLTYRKMHNDSIEGDFIGPWA